MKYGQTFQEESVPQWAHCKSDLRVSWVYLKHMTQPTDCVPSDNVDYDRLKNLIKANTTRDQARALAIPGHADSTLERFEDQFFEELCSEHDRPDLFIKSKVDEINCRLRRFSFSQIHSHWLLMRHRILPEENRPIVSTAQLRSQVYLSEEVHKTRGGY